ncbi:MAG: hypothetical protein SF029_10805 [bacterium]|nr:hypothetical protein [bacterium]
MKAFEELIDQDVRWVQPSSWKEYYELRTDSGDVLATIHKPSIWRNRVEVDAVGNRWTFERKGFWRFRIEIKSVGTDSQPAVFHYGNWMVSGELRFNDGRLFKWKQSDFWGSKWAWTTPDGEPIGGFKVGGFMRLNSDIRLEPGALDMPSLPLLIFLGWYLYLLHYQDSSSAAVVGG